MTKKATKKLSEIATAASSNDNLGMAVHGLAKEIEGIAEELRPLSHIEQMADNLGDIGTALHGMANATAMSVIARYGSDEDRAEAIAYLKGWFERGTFSN